MSPGISTLWALLALAGAAATVVALYLLHPPARRLTVPSTLVWERVLRGSRRTRDRLRWWLSLLLAGAIALTLAAQLLLHWGGMPDARGARLFLVIDNSPTMGARRTDGLTRLQHAQAAARALLHTLPESAQVMVADTARAIAIPRFETRAQALATLERIETGSEPAPRLIAPAAQAAGAVHIFTDGVLLRDLPASAQIHSVFEPAENAGITAFDIRAVPGQPLQQEVFVEIRNAGSRDRQIELTLGSARGVHQRRTVSVPAGARSSQTMDISLADSGPVRIGLVGAGDDALAADDAVYAYLPRRAMARLTLVTESNPYLEKSLATQPDVRLSVVRPSRFKARADADVYVFDRYAPSRPPAAPALYIRSNAAGWPAVSEREAIAPQVTGWDTGHPLLQHLSLRDVYVQRAQLVRAPAADTRVLAGARDNQALIVAYEREPRRVWLGFSLADSNFALQAGFPVFLSNTIAWLTTQSTVVQRSVGRVDLPLSDAKVVGMDGAFLPVRPAGAQLRFDAPEPGIYTAFSPGGTMVVAVNLLSPRVTAVNDSVLQPAALTQPEAAPSAFDPGPALLLAALALLVLEWATYHRRMTV